MRHVDRAVLVVHGVPFVGKVIDVDGRVSRAPGPDDILSGGDGGVDWEQKKALMAERPAVCAMYR